MENIKKVIPNFNWSKSFENISADGKVEHLNETLPNIFRNYVANEKIKCNYRQPLWINDIIKYGNKTCFKTVIQMKQCDKNVATDFKEA